MKILEHILEKITGSTEQYEKGFVNGWNARDERCSHEIELMHDQVESAHEELEILSDECLKREGDLRKENEKLKAQLEIVKKALEFTNAENFVLEDNLTLFRNYGKNE